MIHLKKLLKTNCVLLAYIMWGLPLLLWGISFLAGDNSFGNMVARMFHSYNLYIASPIPDFSSFTGFVGLGFGLWFIFKSIRQKAWADAFLCVVLVLGSGIYFYCEANYYLLSLLPI